MKKKVLMSLVLFAMAGLVFAQQATLDKLKFDNFTNANRTKVRVRAANNSISGVVVIPDTYNGNPVTQIAEIGFRDCTGITSVIIPNGVTTINQTAFQRCTGLTSVTIPASVTQIGIRAFDSCTNLTSVTFLGANTNITLDNIFPGDLRAKQRAGGAGTYTRQAGSNTWTKQAGQIPCPHCDGTGFIRN